MQLQTKREHKTKEVPYVPISVDLDNCSLYLGHRYSINLKVERWGRAFFFWPDILLPIPLCTSCPSQHLIHRFQLQFHPLLAITVFPFSTLPEYDSHCSPLTLFILFISLSRTILLWVKNSSSACRRPPEAGPWFDRSCFLPQLSISRFVIAYMSLFFPITRHCDLPLSVSASPPPSWISVSCLAKSDSSMLISLNTIISDSYRERANKDFVFIWFPPSPPIMFCPITSLVLAFSLHTLSLNLSKIWHGHDFLLFAEHVRLYLYKEITDWLDCINVISRFCKYSVKV